MGVLERDFMQLVLGTFSTLLANRGGIQFLLSGVILSTLYSKLPAVSENMIGTTTRAIAAMLPLDLWVTALKLHGPAPRPIRSRTRAQTVVLV